MVHRGALVRYMDGLQAGGRYAFTLDEVRKALPGNDLALKAALFRVVRKGLASAVRKGFYVVVPPEYRSRGVLPPVLFVDDLMRALGRTYYVGLLSAAALHGAGHEQPQELQVISGLPALRSVSANSARVRFFSRRHMPGMGIEEKKTDTGVIRVSCPELTAMDLVLFERRMGGVNRVGEVLGELAERMRPATLAQLAAVACPVSVVQRLGFLLEQGLGNKELSDPLFAFLRGRAFFPVLLSAGASSRGARNRWKVRADAALEIGT